MARGTDFVSDARQQTTQLIENLNALRALRREMEAQGGASWLKDGAFVGTHEGLVPDDVVAVLFTTLDALDALLAQGHATNLYKLHE